MGKGERQATIKYAKSISFVMTKFYFSSESMCCFEANIAVIVSTYICISCTLHMHLSKDALAKYVYRYRIMRWKTLSTIIQQR